MIRFFFYLRRINSFYFVYSVLSKKALKLVVSLSLRVVNGLFLAKTLALVTFERGRWAHAYA